jgi:hypothetical protein
MSNWVPFENKSAIQYIPVLIPWEQAVISWVKKVVTHKNDTSQLTSQVLNWRSPNLYLERSSDRHKPISWRIQNLRCQPHLFWSTLTTWRHIIYKFPLIMSALLSVSVTRVNHHPCLTINTITTTTLLLLYENSCHAHRKPLWYHYYLCFYIGVLDLYLEYYSNYRGWR